MFKAPMFYIVVGHQSLIVSSESDGLNEIISFDAPIPNVPFYYHLFDKDKKHIEETKVVFKKLGIKNAIVVIPDDSIDIEVDKKVLTEFVMQCGVKRLKVVPQCYLLKVVERKYISVSRTTRAMVMQYINNDKCVVSKYYDKDFTDFERIKLDAQNIHMDCRFETISIYINNVNNDASELKGIGTIISLNEVLANIKTLRSTNRLPNIS